MISTALDSMSFGRFNQQQGHKPLGDINMTPLIDVMLVLMVLFLMTAPLVVKSVKVNLPKATGVQASAPAPAVEVTVTGDGRVWVNGVAQNTQDLPRVLAQRTTSDSETEVRLRVEATVPYARVIEILGIAHKAGLHRIAFVADSEVSRSPEN